MASSPSPPGDSTLSVPPGDSTSSVLNQNGTTEEATKYAMDQMDSINNSKVTIDCEVCNLKFYSRYVFECHMAGSKHQKKLKSVELFKSLEPMQNEFERFEVSGVIRCIVCNITVNSPQLLAVHLAGLRHKTKAASKRPQKQEAEGAPPAKRACNTQQDQGRSGEITDQPILSKESNELVANQGDQSDDDDSAVVGGSRKRKKKKLLDDADNLPDCVTKLVSSTGGSLGYYICNLCSAHCNSVQQLTQHLTSKKHLDKLRGVAPPQRSGRGKRGDGGDGKERFPWNDGNGSYSGRGGTRGARGRGALSYGASTEGDGGFRGGRGRASAGGARGRGGFREGAGLEGSFSGHKSSGAGTYDARGRGRSMHYDSYGDEGDQWYGDEAPSQPPHQYSGGGRSQDHLLNEKSSEEEDFLAWQARVKKNLLIE